MLPLTGDGATQVVLSGPLVVALLVAAPPGWCRSFPCCLPLVPGYLSHLACTSGAETQRVVGTSGAPPEADVVQRRSEPPARTSAATLAQSAFRPRVTRTVVGAMLFGAGFTVVFTSYRAVFGAVGAWLIAFQNTLVRILGPRSPLGSELAKLFADEPSTLSARDSQSCSVPVKHACEN